MGHTDTEHGEPHLGHQVRSVPEFTGKCIDRSGQPPPFLSDQTCTPCHSCRFADNHSRGYPQLLRKPTVRFSTIIFDLYPRQSPIASGITLHSSHPIFEHIDASLRSWKTKSSSRCLVQTLVDWFLCKSVFNHASEILVVVEWAQLLLNNLCREFEKVQLFLRYCSNASY